MAEKETILNRSSEKHLGSEVSKEAAKQHEAIKVSLERAERDHKERHSEKEVLAEAKKLAEEKERHHSKVAASPAERRRGPITKKQLDTSFKSQMNQAQGYMSTSARTFSKIIHARPIEVTSNIIASTLARPNALLCGSIAAFGAVTILYFMAKYYGFSLSGFETIGAFILGWVVGILYDYFSVMMRGKQR